jgi:hypothetical protein
MVWGTAKKGIADVLEKLERNDPNNQVQIIMRTRTISADEAVKLGEVLKQNTTLTDLYASGHCIDESAATAISDALEVNQTLTKLCIGDNTFGDVGVIALANGLASNQGILVLDLEYKVCAALVVHCCTTCTFLIHYCCCYCCSLLDLVALRRLATC